MLNMKCEGCGERPTETKKEENDLIDLSSYSRMADGRAFTDYRSRCQKLTNMTSYDERMFLMNNAESIMKTTDSKFICTDCLMKKDSNKSTMLPEKFKQVCDTNSCKFVVNDENGVGLGR
tara:strand:+ start:2916 stop:3275 length:360 start_codon:yes stop_codon:yes gene_type:complete